MSHYFPYEDGLPKIYYRPDILAKTGPVSGWDTVYHGPQLSKVDTLARFRNRKKPVNQAMVDILKYARQAKPKS